MSWVNTSTKDDKFFTGEWIRKTTEGEKACELPHQSVSWYQLDLSCAQPLQEAHIKTALDHLYRKVPSLGVCFGTHEGELWFRRATNPNVDFKVFHGLRLDDVRETLRTIRYKSDTGPLFCARLLRDSPDIASDTEDLEPSFPNKCHIIFGLHHGMTDGTSSSMIMGFFVTLLNDVISNKPINDEELMGTFVTSEETFRLISAKKPLLECDPELKKKIADDIRFRKENTPFILKSFPTPNVKKHTITIVNTWDLNTTARFLQRCKQEKISVNSVFSAVMNMAIVDVLIEHGGTQESYVIQNLHTVNMRQYWESKPYNPLGMHVSYPLSMYTKTPKDVHDKFWDYARELGQKLKHDLQTGRLLSDKAYDMLTSENISHSEENSDAASCYEGDYLTANLCDVTTRVTEGGPHVRVTNLVRGSPIHEIPIPILLSCQTFRGRFTLAFDYNTALIESVVAEKICTQFKKGILEIVK